MQRQKIRPSFAELQGLDKDDGQDEESGSDDGVPEYAPAATPFRGVPPPVIMSSRGGSSSSSSSIAGQTQSSSKTTGAGLRKSSAPPKVVRIAPETSTQVHEIKSRSTHHIAEQRRRSLPSEGPERFRFDLDEDGDMERSPQRRPAPLIGTIQERVGLNQGVDSRAPDRKKLSKFAQSKKADKNGFIISGNAKGPQIWLDEDGEPMSAFRKSLLLKQGRGPPSNASEKGVIIRSKEETIPKVTNNEDNLDPMMQAISQENQTKVSTMSIEELKQSLQELQDTFGVEMMQKLKARKDGKEKKMQTLPANTEELGRNLDTRQQVFQRERLTDEKMQTTINSSESEDNLLQWTSELEKERDNESDDIPTLRFDFTGKLVEEGALSNEDTHSSGLHHHGDEQHRAGYSLEELLHLARSTLPSQCTIALQTLERVFIRYKSQMGSVLITTDATVSGHLLKSKVQARAAVIASWYIQDRQISVKTAAMRCLDVCSLGDILQALSLLPQGQEKAALNLINIILPTKTEPIASSHLITLSPFINEMLRVTSHHQVNAEDEIIDPLSGIELWKSASSDLPLRTDWPFIALDDLLHSGNCASLNRKNALSTAWDANERQIVIASLGLSLQLWTSILQEASHYTEILPSCAEVQIAIVKVFMLEEDQSQGGKATGLITGRDLFRDEQIAQLLKNLFDLTKQLDRQSNRRRDDLEKVATRQFGSSLPFYQLYTSLIGLYDSISFGTELFGRALLLAQTKEYASDYRRLLWIDYGHCLATIHTTILQSPCSDLKSFLCNDTKDDGIMQAMVNSLLRKTITKGRNELLFSIAVQQIGHIIWYNRSDIQKKLAEAIFRADSSLIEIQDAVEQYGLDKSEEVEEETRLRRNWLEQVSKK